MIPTFCFQGEPGELALGAKEMAGHLGFTLSDGSGTPIIATRTEWTGVLDIEMSLGEIRIRGIREVFATFWGNDGNEANYDSGMLGMQWFAEHGYTRDVPDAERVNRRFAICSGDARALGENFLVLSLFDEVPGVDEKNLGESNPSKFLLWQDILLDSCQ